MKPSDLCTCLFFICPNITCRCLDSIKSNVKAVIQLSPPQHQRQILIWGEMTSYQLTCVLVIFDLPEHYS